MSWAPSVAGWLGGFLLVPAIIGPPEMQIESLAESLHLRFSAPQIENEPETWTLKNIYDSWAYRVQYWKNGTSLPQHLKEFLGHPHHSTFLLFSFPPPEEAEVFDKLSIISEESEGSKQSPEDNCASEPPSDPGPRELESKDEAPSPPHDDPKLLTSTSEV